MKHLWKNRTKQKKRNQARAGQQKKKPRWEQTVWKLSQDWLSAGRLRGNYWPSLSEPCVLSVALRCKCVPMCPWAHLCAWDVSEGPSQHGAARTFGPHAVDGWPPPPPTHSYRITGWGGGILLLRLFSRGRRKLANKRFSSGNEVELTV